MYRRTTIHRMLIIQGHLKKIIEMVESNRGYLEIHQQIKAVTNALKSIDESLLEEYLRNTFNHMFKRDKSSQKMKNEILELFIHNTH